MSEEVIACPKCNSFYVSQYHITSIESPQGIRKHTIYSCLDCGFDWTPQSEDHIDALLVSAEKAKAELARLRRVITSVSGRSEGVDDTTYKNTWKNIAKEIENGKL